MHAHNKIQPGTTMDDIVELRKANPGGGPHSMTGPDVRQRRRARRRDGDPHPEDHAQGVRDQLPPARRGVPDDRRARARISDGFVRYFYLDLDKKQTEFKPGVVIDLQPFPGTLAVGIDPNEP